MTGWVLSEKKILQPKKTYILRKRAQELKKAFIFKIILSRFLKKAISQENKIENKMKNLHKTGHISDFSSDFKNLLMNRDKYVFHLEKWDF